MVCSWGMSEKLGPRAFGDNQEIMFLGREINKTQDYSESTAVKIDAEVDRLINDAYERAKSLINEHRDNLELIATTLLEQETLDGRDVEEIVEHGRILSEMEREKIDAENADEPEEQKAAKPEAEEETPPPPPDEEKKNEQEESE
jgi:cell division protease FtsH